MYRLRERIPGLAIRTTFITGFPGETEDDHRQLVDFVRDFQFDMMGVFKYSHEDGTVAATMEDDPKLRVPEEVKERYGEGFCTKREADGHQARVPRVCLGRGFHELGRLESV